MEPRVDQDFVSIIVLSYNSLSFILKCLGSVLQTRYGNFEVILVDNASTDDTINVVEKEFSYDSRLRIVSNERNLGFAEGNNVGASLAKGEYLVFLNADTVADPNWLDELLRIIQSDSSIGVCQSKLLSMENPEIIDSTGDFIDHHGVMMRRGGDLHEKDEGQYDHVQEIFSARAAAMMVKRETIDEVGLFDSNFFITYEDIDFCWRVHLRGYRVLYAPKSIVYHAGEAFTRTEFKVFFTTRNWLISLLKNYELKTLTKILPSAMAIAASIIGAEIFLRWRPDLASRRVRGVLWIVRHFKEIYRQRLKVQFRIRSRPDSEVMKYMLKTNLAVSYWLPLWRQGT